MKKENLFFLVLLLAILAVRIALFVLPESHLRIGGVVIHHFWIGVLLLIASLLFLKRFERIKFFSTAIAVGWIVDEAVYLLFGGGLRKEYFQLPSVLGMLLLLPVVYFFRARILKVLIKR